MVKEILKFAVVNCAISGADVATDLFSFLDLLLLQHHRWAGLTLFWIFLPFLVHLAIFLVRLARGSYPGSFTITVLRHFPFAMPFRNLWLCTRLLWLVWFGEVNATSSQPFLQLDVGVELHFGVSGGLPHRA